MATFINPFTDTGFKIIFGKENESNEILRSFLNVLFSDQPGFEPIESVEYRPTERTREWSGGKSIVYDIYCRTSSGRMIIVEMQKNAQEFFLSRAVYYVSRAIADQGYRGRRESESEDGSAGDYWDYDVIPVVGVFFSNFFIEGLERKLVTHVRLQDTDSGKPLGDYMRYVFIQLPAFRKSEQECSGSFDEWIYNLKHMGTMEEMRFTSHQDIFKRLARVGSLATLSPMEREQYEYDLKKARDYQAEMSYARKTAMEKGVAQGMRKGMIKGIARGRMEGRAEGIETGKMEVARRMLSRGMSDEDIVTLSGISAAQLSALRSECAGATTD